MALKTAMIGMEPMTPMQCSAMNSLDLVSMSVEAALRNGGKMDEVIGSEGMHAAVLNENILTVSLMSVLATFSVI